MSISSKFIFEIMNDAKEIDLIDINFFFCNKKYGVLKKFPNLSKGGLISGLSRLFIKLIVNFSIKGLGGRTPPKNKVYFFVGTNNQYKVLKPIHDLVNESVMVGVTYKNKGVNYHYPVFYVFLLSFLFIPTLIKTYKKSRGYIRHGLKVGFDCFFSTPGTYLLHRILLSTKSPLFVVVSNDCVYFYRSLIKACKDTDIPVCYVQHASVTKDFPELNFDVSMLFGEDTWKKYNELQQGGEVYLIGDTSVEETNYLPTKVDNSIGVSTNKLSTFDDVSLLIRKIQDSNYTNIILRPHPGDRRRSLWAGLAKKYNIEISDSRKETSFTYFKKIKYLISGNSGIILEAARAGVIPIIWIKNNDHDHYEFSAHEIAYKASSVNEILNKLNQNLSSIRESKIQYYYEDIGTAWHYKSYRLAVEIINAKALGADKEIQGIKKVPNKHCTLFRIIK